MVRPKLIDNLTGSRLKIATFVEHPYFIAFITILILTNAVTLGLETNSAMLERYGDILSFIDFSVIVIFTIEISLKLYAYRLSFFRSGWNWFDLTIVAIAWIPAQGTFAVLRTLRILRVLRLISIIPQMRRVIVALGYSLPGMGAVMGVLLILFYVSAVLATKLFGHGADPFFEEYFGSVGASAFTLFQVMTLEGWSDGIVRPTMEEFPWAWMFFLPFIVVTSFAVLNLFIGIIVDAMAFAAKDPNVDPEDQDHAESDHVIAEMMQRLERMEEQQNKMLEMLENNISKSKS